MSKTRQKTKSEVELLRGRVRKLESENRRLRRENKSLNKKAHFHETILDEIGEEVDPKVDICKECGKGEIGIIDLVHVMIESCNKCEYRKKLKTKR